MNTPAPMHPFVRFVLGSIHIVVNTALVMFLGKWTDPLFRRLGRKPTLESGEAMVFVALLAAIVTGLFWLRPFQRRPAATVAITLACAAGAVVGAWFLGSAPVIRIPVKTG